MPAYDFRKDSETSEDLNQREKLTSPKSDSENEEQKRITMAAVESSAKTKKLLADMTASHSADKSINISKSSSSSGSSDSSRKQKAPNLAVS